MSLDSTDTLPKVNIDNNRSGQGLSCPEILKYTEMKESGQWCYIYTHSSKVNSITQKLEELFTVFIHKTIIYDKKSHVRAVEKPTISGLVFIQGNPDEIQKFLFDNILNTYLVKDCSTGKPAVIPHKVMASFMKLSTFEPSRIRFMPNPFEYYSKGHVMVRVTSGSMSGMEGYLVRIARDRCLISSIGGITVAISGVHKESFENAEEFIGQYNELKPCTQVAEILEEIYQTLK